MIENSAAYIIPGLKTMKVPFYTLTDKETIFNKVVKYFNCMPERMMSKERQRPYVLYRQICIYLFFRRVRGITCATAGGFFGLDHATALHAKKTINNLLSYDKELQKQITEIENLLC